MKIYLTAVLTAKIEHREEVFGLLQDMVTQTRLEPACEQYDLHHGLDDPNVFVFYEIWTDQQGLDAHNEQPYIQNFQGVAGKLLREPPLLVRMALI